ncbi:hypothetical protein ACHHYP_10533 [Achlya hypogyna]|uniref:Uncharacterized protein n=1 Tax=Achlya hypogyna TaxID=1202772 RepID=A0A1V9YL50_ACHHY|nr:hypothetical protein ACHHYP_10533 [Achlya hypogyna]
MEMLGSVKVLAVTPVSEKRAAKTLDKFLATQHDALEADKLNVQADVQAQLELIRTHLQKTA